MSITYSNLHTNDWIPWKYIGHPKSYLKHPKASIPPAKERPVNSTLLVFRGLRSSKQTYPQLCVWSSRFRWSQETLPSYIKEDGKEGEKYKDERLEQFISILPPKIFASLEKIWLSKRPPSPTCRAFRRRRGQNLWTISEQVTGTICSIYID